MVRLLTIATLITSACNPNSYQQHTHSESDGTAIRQVFGLRTGMEMNATMFAATALTDFSGMSQQEDQQDNDSPGNAQAGGSQKTDNKHNTPMLADELPSKNTNCVQKKSKWGKSYKTSNKDSPYCQVSNLLPTDSQAQSFSGNTQAGVFKLASHYCSKLMANSEEGKAIRLAKLPTVAEHLNTLDLQQRPVNISEEISKQLAKDLLNNFNSPASAAEQQILVELIAELSKTKEENGQLPSLRQVLIGVCTAALGSAQTIFY